MKCGIDKLLENSGFLGELKGRRVALLAHPASVTKNLQHTIDALLEKEVNLTCAFGPQHGLKGDKQDNMIETPDEMDTSYGIPVYSLYGEVRRPTEEAMSLADVFIYDLQDLGCRIYTFVTTLLYLLQEAEKYGKEVWVLDRPNPIGRKVEGTILRKGQESFVGAAPIPMRHGLTMGEMGLWFIRHYALDVKYKVIKMDDWEPSGRSGGWPRERVWVNPSPNAPSVYMARAYPGTVMLEGTTLSEGRGTTRPLEFLFGAPDINASDVLSEMKRLAPDWLAGVEIRECYFEPTFHKHAGKLLQALMVHTDGNLYNDRKFRPWRLQALTFKAIRSLYPNYQLWRDFPYEYESDRLAIDVINGGTDLRVWVDDGSSTPSDLDVLADKDEKDWQSQVEDFLLY